jgi:hypothetical protein
LTYARLRSSHGPDAARVFAESNAAAIARWAKSRRSSGLAATGKGASNYVYTESSGRLDRLQEESNAMRAAGIAAELTRETDLPFPVAGAIRVDDQAQFHPVKFLAGLVARIPSDGGHVFEGTRATSVRRPTRASSRRRPVRFARSTSSWRPSFRFSTGGSSSPKRTPRSPTQSLDGSRRARPSACTSASTSRRARFARLRPRREVGT